MIENRLTKEEYERILALDSYLTVVYRMKMVIRVCAIASRKRLMEDLQQYGSMIQQIIMKEMMYCMTPIAVKEAIPTFDDMSPTGGGINWAIILAP